MQSVSDAFLDAIGNSHQFKSIATLIETDGTETVLDVIDGSVTLDGTAATRGACSLTLSPDTPIPDEPTSLLAPYGNEIRVERGVIFTDGTWETVPLGVFRLDETDVSDSGEVAIEVSCLDRSSIVIDAVFERTGNIAQGTNIGTAIEDLLNEVPALADVPRSFATVTTTTPLLSYEAGDDRWDFCQGLAEAALCDLYFDGTGTLVLRHAPQSNVADFTVSEGTNLLGISKRWGRENGVNRVVVTGETSGETPVYGEAIDDDPQSPTWYYGDFGQLTFAYSSEYVIDDDQAATVAQNILDQKLGTGQQIAFESLVNPALEPSDLIQVTRERLGVNELHILDQITIPLTAEGSMSGQTRVARVF